MNYGTGNFGLDIGFAFAFAVDEFFTLAGKGACFQQIGLVINAGEGALRVEGEGQPMARMHLFEGFGFFAALQHLGQLFVIQACALKD